jgi:hypothetical protein
MSFITCNKKKYKLIFFSFLNIFELVIARFKRGSPVLNIYHAEMRASYSFSDRQLKFHKISVLSDNCVVHSF